MVRRHSRRRLPSTVRLPPFHRRHRTGLLVAAVLAVLATIGRWQPRTAPTALAAGDMVRYHNKVFTVVKVVDGDTVDIDAPDRRYRTTRVRLRGVDTPETADAPTGEMYWGKQASRFARETLQNRAVRLELVDGDTRGRYGRLLAYVYLGESAEMFNEMLLRQGHAYADTRFKHPYRDRFLELEAEARAQAVGLWRDVTVNRMPGWRQRREPRRR
jgi:micrococcal nuclease